MWTLDEIVVRAALIDARRLRGNGMSAETAASFACHGAWHPYREEVARLLQQEAAQQADPAAAAQAAEERPPGFSAAHSDFE